MELAEAVELFLAREGETGGYKPETIRAYRQTLDPLLEAIGSQRPIEYVTIADLEYYINKNIRGHGSPHTQYKHIKAIKAFFKYLSDYLELLEKNPARKIKQVKLPKTRKTNAMPDDCYHRLVDHCWRQHKIFELALVLFFGDSAGRLGGAWTLTVERLNLDERAAWVIEKADSDGEVYFGEFCELALRDWLGYRKYPSEYVFSSDYSKGSQFRNPEALALRFRRACLAAGIGSWGPHALRKRKNVMMAEAGVLDEVRARVLRHSVEVNRTWYTEFSNQTIRATSDRFHTSKPEAKNRDDDGKIIHVNFGS
ncbi:MAG: tyrosine-type recombinase/integrase [Anaerolineae bacterium]|nr:tyrosine-type recombinase/integrase [Anaerolineae bacterium]